MERNIVFLHGLEGSPEGAKPTHLRSLNYTVHAPALDTSKVREVLRTNSRPTGLDESVFAEALKAARAAIMEHNPDVLVGSSFGGGLAAYLAAKGFYRGPIVLLAPAATKLFGIDSLEHPSRIAVVHGRDDDVVPVLDSLSLVTGSSGEVSLTLVDDNHRLGAAGLEALPRAIEWAAS